MNIIESLSYGTPVLAPNFGNSGILIKDGINGYKYELKSTVSFIKSLDMIVKNPLVFEKAYKDYLDNYMEDKNYSILLDIFILALSEVGATMIHSTSFFLRSLYNVYPKHLAS